MNDKQRAEFEKWLQEGYNKDWLVSCNGYADPTVDRMWLSWQAALSSVVVELPEMHDGSNPCRCYYDKDEVEQALTEAGIRYE